MSQTCKLETFHKYKALISFKFENKEWSGKLSGNSHLIFWRNSLIEKGKHLVEINYLEYKPSSPLIFRFYNYIHISTFKHVLISLLEIKYCFFKRWVFIVLDEGTFQRGGESNSPKFWGGLFITLYRGSGRFRRWGQYFRVLIPWRTLCRTCPKSEFLIKLWPQFNPWRWPKSDKVINSGKRPTHLAIQIIQNQGPISFQFSMKTIITFCSIWAFLKYKWVQGQRSVGHSLHKCWGGQNVLLERGYKPEKMGLIKKWRGCHFFITLWFNHIYRV